MPRPPDAGFWLGFTLLALLIAWGAWRLSAPPLLAHPSIIVDVGRG